MAAIQLQVARGPMALEDVLSLFDIDELKPEQKTLIEASIAGRDTLGILPTSFGKSACYQIPGIVTGDKTIVVSPLIALQEDQVHALRRRGIRAYAIHSNMDDLTKLSAYLYFMRARQSEPAFLYVSPEQLVSDDFMRHFGKVGFKRIAIDEAHCVSTWGNAFRPDYQRLRVPIKKLGIEICSAFTATLDPRIEKDIVNRLPLKPDVVRVEADPVRPNLILAIEDQSWGYRITTKGGQKKLVRMCDLLQIEEYVGPAIVYCNTRSGSAVLYKAMVGSDFAKKTGYAPFLFHGELPYEDKQMALDGFLTKERPLVFATSAFGLGIDRADVRQVIHYNVPYTLIDYAQQIGRGGRDGKNTLCTAFHAKEDYLSREVKRVGRETPPYDFVERVLRNLRTTIGKLPDEKKGSYSLRHFISRTDSLVNDNEHIKNKTAYMQRFLGSISILQQVGLIAEDPRTGLKVFPAIPGTPPHRALIERTQMHERMLLREKERMAQFFGTKDADQGLLWNIIRSD